MSELAFLSASEIADKINAKEVSSVEILNHYFERIDQFNPELNAVVIEVRKQALQDAQAADDALAKGQSLGPFHGVPMTVKESYNIVGEATTWGNPDWRDNIATEDAESIKKLKNIGVVVHGKTNVPLALADFQSYNDVYGTTNNPYDHNRTPGGSSGGSAAALAAGLTALETGSDIGGSIRNPAHFCGVFGHKPTWNLLWMRGHAGPGDLRSAPDISVIGPLSRSARDLEVAVQTMAGPDEIMARGYQLNLPTMDGRTTKDLKIAVWKDDELCPVDHEVRARVEQVAAALKAAGATINEDARPAFTAAHSHDTYQHLLQATMASRMPDEDYRSLQEHVAKLDPNDNSPAAKVFRGQTTSFRDWKGADELRSKLRWQWHEFFNDYDLLITPIMPTAAFKHDQQAFSKRRILVNNEERPYFEQVFWAGLTGVSYLPSTVIPTGLNDQGLPIGVQIVGPEFSDLVCIQTAKMLEADGFKFTPPPAYT